MESVTGESEEPYDIISFPVEPGDSSSSPAEVESVPSEAGEPYESISFLADP